MLLLTRLWVLILSWLWLSLLLLWLLWLLLFPGQLLFRLLPLLPLLPLLQRLGFTLQLRHLLRLGRRLDLYVPTAITPPHARRLLLQRLQLLPQLQLSLLNQRQRSGRWSRLGAVESRRGSTCPARLH